MGERKLAPVMAMKAVAAACQESIGTMIEPVDEAMQVRTPGGVFAVRWDERGSATALGQMAFFAEYFEATGLFERWRGSCPLSCASPNAPELVDVLGTWMLSILDGHCRYAHVGALRGDGVAPSILWMNKIIGDDSLRRALSAIAPAPDAKHTQGQRAAQQAQLARSVQWMQEQLRHSIAQATAEPWIAGLRHDDQAAVRQARRRAGQLQPAQARPAEPRHPHLLDRQPAPGAGCPARARQPAQPGALQGGPDGLAGGHAPGATPQAGSRRLCLWQRRRDERAGGCWPALPVQAASKRRRQEARAATVDAARLVPRGPRLGRLRRRSAADRLDPAPARHRDAPGAQDRPDCAGASAPAGPRPKTPRRSSCTSSTRTNR